MTVMTVCGVQPTDHDVCKRRCDCVLDSGLAKNRTHVTRQRYTHHPGSQASCAHVPNIDHAKLINIRTCSRMSSWEAWPCTIYRLYPVIVHGTHHPHSTSTRFMYEKSSQADFRHEVVLVRRGDVSGSHHQVVVTGSTKYSI